MIFAVIGVLWLWWGKKYSYKLQALEASAWIAEEHEKEMVEYEKVPTLRGTADEAI